MEFRLVYEGPLPSGNSADRTDKHLIREALHPQLQDLWARPPLVRLLNLDSAGQPPRDPALLKIVDGIHFLPLVSERLSLEAQVDVTLLRPEGPGSIIISGGDLDNRLKTLFDALRAPKDAGELPLGMPPWPAGALFYCLLEDDALIREVSVRADRLLAPNYPAEVIVLLRVRVRATALTWENLDLSS
jgi:hypothetical protein